jgi:hypothetical protein
MDTLRGVLIGLPYMENSRAVVKIMIKILALNLVWFHIRAWKL